MSFRLVVIGTSKGGLQALGCLLEGLPADFPVPVAVVQHRGNNSGPSLASILAKRCLFPVVEAEDKDPLVPGSVYIAPGDYHLLVDEDHFALSTEAPVGYARPSIDVLFDSAARALHSGVIGVVLTGSGHDGAAGAAQIKACGGLVLVEDPGSAMDGTMPAAAVRAAPVDQVLELSRIAPALVQLCTKG